MKQFLLVFVLVAACSKHADARPSLTPALLVPEAKGLLVNRSTLDDVVKALPDATRSDMTYNGQQAIKLEAGPVVGIAVAGKLVKLEIHKPGLVDWLVKTMDKLPGATSCPGNRVVGHRGDHAVYCADAGDRVAFIDAEPGDHGDELTYGVPTAK